MEVQQQRELVRRSVLQVPEFAEQELLILGVDAEGLVEGDEHALSAGLPLLYLLRHHVQGLHQPLPTGRVALLQLLHQFGCEPEVRPRHHVGEHVVVHHGRVLVGTGDAMDVESFRPIGLCPPETQVRPHPRRLHQHSGTVTVQEVGVPCDVAVLGKGMRDVGIDVVLGGTCSVVGRSLLTVDGAPREKRPLLAEHLSTLLRLRQQADAVPQGVTSHSRGGVGQEGHQVHLGVPEVMPLVPRPRDPLGRDPELIGSGRGLGQLEQAPADGLLDGGLPAHLDIRVGPELIEPGALRLEERVETPFGDPVQGAAAPVEELCDRHAAGGVISHGFADHDRHPGTRLNPVDLLRLVLLDPGDHLVGVRGLEGVFNRHAQRHVGIGGLVSECHPLVVVPLTTRLQHPAIELARAARVESLLVLPGLAVVVEAILAVNHLGAEDDRGIALQHGQLDLEQRQVPVGETDHAAGTQLYPLACRGAPDQVTG